MESQAKGGPSVQRMHMVKTDGITGEKTTVYAYQHRDPWKTLLWKILNGPNGEWISDEEARKFEPQ